MWTKNSLQDLIKEKMGDYLFIIASNRQPVVHSFKGGKIIAQRGVGGVISALDPVMQACEGLWVAYGNGQADAKVTDAQGKVKVPLEDPKYTLKRVWLSKEEEIGYYYGYSNEVLWPLCHMAFKRPVFRKEDWEFYQRVNQKFARAIIEEIGSRKAFVWIQDYHLCLLAKYLKESIPNQIITAHFWHIPWPNYEAFRICPQRREILEGLLANDLLGFHIRYHCNNFIDVVDRELESKIDRERFSIVKNDHETLIRPYPISIDYNGIQEHVCSQDVARFEKVLVDEYGLEGLKVMVGLDRIDYTKGIPERILAMDLLLDQHPELKGKVVMLQIGVMTRTHLEQYKDLNDEINSLVEQVNWKHSVDGWKPIVFVRQHFSITELLALYRISDVGLVTSLHDGMNLVAKEYVAAHSDGKGVLVLSQFTGAARELTDAVLINPYDRQQAAEAIYTALMMAPDERKRRMNKMTDILKTNNIFRWAGKIISELLKFDFKE